MVTNKPPYQFLAKHKGKSIKIQIKCSEEIYEGILSDLEVGKHYGLRNILLRDKNNEIYWTLIRGNQILFIYL